MSSNQTRLLEFATFLLLLASPALAQEYLTGTVKSSDGKPLAEVSVSDGRKGSTTTDSQGMFRIKRVEPVFFFWLTGYEPLAIVPEQNQNEFSVAMQASAGKTWLVPNCKDKLPNSNGLELRFAIPEQAKIELVNDVDYQKRFIRYPHGKKKDWLVIWIGGAVSIGHPISDDFLNAASFQERSLSWQNIGGIVAGAAEDARGVMKSGGLWRWTGGLGKFAEYRDVSPAAAQYFDQIIDGMCNEGYPRQSAATNKKSRSLAELQLNIRRQDDKPLNIEGPSNIIV